MNDVPRTTRSSRRSVGNNGQAAASLSQCCLCCQVSENCVDISTVPSVTTEYISQNVGIHLALNSVLCINCISSLTNWQKFVSNCIEAQSTLKVADDAEVVEENGIGEEEEVPVESAEEPLKKSRFTLEYLEQKLGRPLETSEAEELTKLIGKGEDRQIFGRIFGSGSTQTWRCQICPQIIKGSMKEVARHYDEEHQHHQPLYPCQLCGKVIKSAHTYKRHRTAHLSEYKCPSCDKVFADRSKLLAHLVTHSDNRPFECSLCGKQYKMAAHLRSHQSRSHAASESDRLSFTCEICGKRFSAKGNLTTHVQTTHSESRPFVCELCGKGVKTKQALQFHMNSHSGLKRFNCSLCSMTFTTRNSMAAHTRRHTGEKPYPCKHCDKTFTSSSARSSHLQHVHATSRKHVCPYCSKSFKVMRDLRVHQSIHTGEKPYICDTCGKAFRVAANFYAHRKKHRLNNNNNTSVGGGGSSSGIVPLPSINEIGQHHQHQQSNDDEMVVAIMHTLQPVDVMQQMVQEDHHQLQLHQQQQQQPDALSQAIQGTLDGIDYVPSGSTNDQVDDAGNYLKHIILMDSQQYDSTTTPI